MKGLPRGCIIGLVGIPAAIAAFYFWFQALGLNEDTSGGASLTAGVLTMLSILMLWSVVDVRRNRALLQGAVAGVAPVDGTRAGFSGVIRASSPLTSPFSRTTAVAYKYLISERIGKNKWTRYEGMALAASTISTSLGSYRLLAVPALDISNPAVDPGTARRNAEAYIAATRFETPETAEADRQTFEMEWTDDDGEFRRDLKGNDAIDFSGCWFGEQVVAQGEQVCVLGLYSQARGGIIPGPDWGGGAQLLRGDGEAVIRQLSSKVRNYTIAAFVFAAAAAGVCLAVIKYWTP